jgi:uncharacterized integral membrane protein
MRSVSLSSNLKIKFFHDPSFNKDYDETFCSLPWFCLQNNHLQLLRSSEHPPPPLTPNLRMQLRWQCNDQVAIPGDSNLACSIWVGQIKAWIPDTSNHIQQSVIIVIIIIVVVVVFVVQNGSGVHPASYPMGTGGSYPGYKATGAWSWPFTSI